MSTWQVGALKDIFFEVSIQSNLLGLDNGMGLECSYS
jgi:hypothetical protein